MKKGFWLYILLATASCILLILGSYVGWFFFHLERNVSSSGEQWGQFGDFVGGILNPLLSFMTICILIKTSLAQEKQTEILDKREKNKRFDDRFYAMVTQLKQSFDNLSFNFGTNFKWDGVKLIKLMEDTLFNGKDMTHLQTPQYRNAIFPVVRQFYLLLKMIKDEFNKGNIDEQELSDYYVWLINCTDYNLLRFVIFSSCYYDSVKASQYIVNTIDFISELRKLGYGSYIDKIKELKK